MPNLWRIKSQKIYSRDPEAINLRMKCHNCHRFRHKLKDCELARDRKNFFLDIREQEQEEEELQSGREAITRITGIGRRKTRFN